MVYTAQVNSASCALSLAAQTRDSVCLFFGGKGGGGVLVFNEVQIKIILRKLSQATSLKMILTWNSFKPTACPPPSPLWLIIVNY